MVNSRKADKPARLVEKAIRLVPVGERARYGEEWRSDLIEASDHQQRVQVGKASMAMACRIKMRHFGTLLLGGHGIGPALLLWLVIVTVIVFFPIFPIVVTTVLILLIIAALYYAGTPSQGSFVLMLFSVLGALISLSYFIVAFRAAFNAADTSRPIPVWASFDGEALLGFLGFGVLFFISLIWSFWRTRHN